MLLATDLRSSIGLQNAAVFSGLYSSLSHFMASCRRAAKMASLSNVADIEPEKPCIEKYLNASAGVPTIEHPVQRASADAIEKLSHLEGTKSILALFRYSFHFLVLNKSLNCYSILNILRGDF